MSAAAAELLIAVGLMAAAALGVHSASEGSGWCKPGGEAPQWACVQTDAALLTAGVNPAGVYPPSWEWSERISNRQAALRIVYCESRFRPGAFNPYTAEGDYWGARGLAQVTERWFPEVADEQAYSPAWSLAFVARALADGVLHRLWPECRRAMVP